MGRKFQCLAIIISIFIVIVAYLIYLPDTEGVEQMNRIRSISASMKIIRFISFVSETLGFTPRWRVYQSLESMLKMKKRAEVNTDLNIEDTNIEGVPVRIYSQLNSDDKKARPAIVFYHGGAFYLGSIETHHPMARDLARQTGFIVISVEYRLAPQHPFPAGLDDCMTVTKYVLDSSNSQKLNIDPKRVAISGDSAGGNFAAVVAQRFASNSISVNVPRLQVLIYPVVQFFDLMLPSYLTAQLQIFDLVRSEQLLGFYMNKSISEDIMANNHTSVAQKKHYRRYVDWSFIPEKYRQVYREPITDQFPGDPTLIENAKGLLHPDVSPLLAEDEVLAKLPPTYILTVGHDRLRDEGFIYAGRLKANRVNVVHHHFENTFHGVLSFSEGRSKLDIAHVVFDDIVKYLKNNL